MQTIKIKYHTDSNNLDVIRDYQDKYTNLLRWMYNRVRDGLAEKQREKLVKTLNNLDILDSWFIRSVAKQAQWINDTNKDKVVVFGGKKNCIRRAKGLITREEYLEKRRQPLTSIGEAIMYGNRKFRLSDTIDKVVFSPNRYTHIDLVFDGLSKNYKKVLTKLYICQETKSLPITYQLSQEYIYIMFDEKQLYQYKELKQKTNRVMAIDLNPNYIGWSIVDWISSNEFNVIKHGVYSLKRINDKQDELNRLKLSPEDKQKVRLTNKRKNEVMQISKNLINKAMYYQCEMFSVENLDIQSKDNEKGKKFNRLVNSYWVRDKFIQNLEKRCNIFGIKFMKVTPNYSSFIGNVVFRNLRLADMELASVEIGRRAYEFKKQFIDKIEKQRKNIVFPNEEAFSRLISQSLEELGVNSAFSSLRDLYYFLKKSKIRYRLSFDNVGYQVFSRCFSKRSLILKY